jgi:hypothetical protein
MQEKPAATFQEAIDVVESLPQYQQEDLINILRNRILEQKRESLIKSIHKARAEYKRGKVKRGSVDDLLKDISELDVTRFNVSNR